MTNLLIIFFFYWLLPLVYWHLEVMGQDSVLSSHVRYLSLIFVGFICFCLVLNLGLDIYYVLLGFQSTWLHYMFDVYLRIWDSDITDTCWIYMFNFYTASDFLYTTLHMWPQKWGVVRLWFWLNYTPHCIAHVTAKMKCGAIMVLAKPNCKVWC